MEKVITFFGRAENQVMISKELVVVIEWLLYHEQSKLKKIIARAYDERLERDVKKVTDNEVKVTHEDAQDILVDFFLVLESLFIEVIREREVHKEARKKALPSLNKIDPFLRNNVDMNYCANKSIAARETASPEEAENVLYEELLKRWRPTKKAETN